MLNKKTLTRLAVVTGVSVAATVILLNYARPGGISGHNKPLLPDLLKTTSHITKLIIQDHDQTMTLVRGKEYWEIVEKNNFPVLHDKVEELLYSLADMRIVEPKTTNKNLYAQLDVNDVGENNSKAVLVTLQNQQQQDVTKLIIGKRQGLKVGEEYTERLFVRKAGDAQTWLVQGLVPLTNDFKDLVEQPLLGLVDSNQIKRVVITKPDAEPIVIAKTTPEQEDFALQTAVTKPSMVLDLDAVNTLPFEIVETEYDDASLQSQHNIDWSKGVQAQIQTFVGVNVNMDVVQQNGKVYAKVLASTADQSSDEIKNDVKKFNAMHAQWCYELPEQFYKMIAVSNADFLKVEETPTGVVS